jgi:hypothetical protein
MKEFTQDTTTNDANYSSALAVATKAREKKDSRNNPKLSH